VCLAIEIYGTQGSYLHPTSLDVHAWETLSGALTPSSKEVGVHVGDESMTSTIFCTRVRLSVVFVMFVLLKLSSKGPNAS
jgi:hypothetical protein